MRAYSMPHQQVMQLPMKVFWHLSGTVPRLWADEQRNLLEVQMSVNSEEGGVATLMERIDKIAPDPVVATVAARIQASSVRDEEGFNELRSLAG